MGRKKKIIDTVSIEPSSAIVDAKADLVRLLDEQSTMCKYLRYLQSELDEFYITKFQFIVYNILTLGLSKTIRTKIMEMRRTIRHYEAEVIVNKSNIHRLDKEITEQEHLIETLENGRKN